MTLPLPELKLRFTEDCFLAASNQCFSMQSKEQFIEYFLPKNFQYQIVSKESSADLCIVSANTTEGIRQSEFNLLISVENYKAWSWYKHRNKYGETGDSNIHAYFYAHYSDFLETDQYVILPTIHAHLNYFSLHMPSTLRETLPEKTCLMINRSGLNPAVQGIVGMLRQIGLAVDSIKRYSLTIRNKSCYYSPELLDVFKQYKFIVCVENSYADGYITEKIFNCFFAQVVPLYLGANDITKYIQSESFVDLRTSNWQTQILDLNINVEAYCKMVNAPKIQNSHLAVSQVYLEKLENRIQRFMNNKNLIKKIIAFSLWGTDPFYNYGAYENAILALTIFPGWICRYYYFDADPKIISLLSELDHVELVEMTKTEQNSNMFWRFEPAFSEKNIILLSRDADSRLNLREKRAVDEWLASDKDFHIIRDHPGHKTPILGGTWGARNDILSPLKEQFENFNRAPQRGHDQTFLAQIVYPFVQSKSLIHDAHHFYPHEQIKIIPHVPEYPSFVGSYCLNIRETAQKLNLDQKMLPCPERIRHEPSHNFYWPAE